MVGAHDGDEVELVLQAGRRWLRTTAMRPRCRCRAVAMGVAEDEIFYRRCGVRVRVGEGCWGEEGGATDGGEGRPVAAAPCDGEVEGEASAAKAEGR